MRHSIVRALDHSIAALALCAICGCFNEPEPAYKSVPSENRIYLQGKKLHDLKSVGLNRAADYLNLDRNLLTNIDEVASMTSLKWLRLNENRLRALPDMSGLKSLRRVYLRANQFTIVPETLKDLPELTDIELSWNPIKEIPGWLAAKRGLENLSFSHTQIRQLPSDLSAWKGLKSLQLGDVPLSPQEMARVRKALPDVAIVY